MNELTIVDLFSGIGGFSLAGDRAGFRTVCFAEVDPYASAVLGKHWPGVPNLGDITKADFSPYAGATVLTGGFPCQPFSVAGKRRGKTDDRFLWPAMLSVIAAVKPAWVLGENVAGIVRMELDRVLADLEGQGYFAVPLVIPACAVEADHRRFRVWAVAYLDGPGLQVTRKRGASEGASKGVSIQPAFTSFPGREAYPELLRSVHGLPRRMDRIKCLGNAIVPQVAEVILRAIAQIERGEVK